MDHHNDPTSTPSRWRSRRARYAVGGLIAIAGIGTATYVAAATNTTGRADRTITFDVAENGTRFAFDAAPLFDDGMPAYGNDFVTEGFIFEPGTLDDSVAFDADGNVLPEVEDKIIGEWKCFGFMIGDGAHTETGEWVVSTQTYRFYGDDGRTTDDAVIVSTGTENVPGEPVVRAVTGGTGSYDTARGEVHQLTTGFGENMGVLAEFTIELTKP